MRGMGWMRTGIMVIIGAISLALCPTGLGQGVDKPPRPPEDDPNANVLWREHLRLPGDSFLMYGTGQNGPAWVKFTIVPQSDGSKRVYFQDGHAYPFHYQGAVKHLDQFAEMTTDQFDRATLYRQGRKAVLGAVIAPVIWSLSTQPAEYGIQLVGHDPFTREEIAEIFALIGQAIETQEPHRAFYFPTYEQRTAAEADRIWLESQGILISSSDRWANGNSVYSSGWALGTLKFVEGRAIGDAYRSGQLGPGDILLTDGVPAEAPHLAGIITLSPSTPNSHVAILAKTSGMPFLHLTVPEEASRAQELIGHRICLRAYDLYGWTTVRLIDTEGILDEPTAQAIVALKTPPGLDISPVTPLGYYGAGTDALMPADICYVGGKAANFGMLRRAIPENSPVSAAVSFDLWSDFLAQKLADGRTLRENIAARLSSFSYPPENTATLSATLEEIRDLIEDDKTIDFTDAQKQAVLSVLQEPRYSFDPSRNLRFRSSTNVEDGREFTGAGLYDSYSGCLADDLDGDGDGSCRCDPNRAKERGVFTAIRKVFASFYNDNAYLERLRHGIDEAQVGMAMLVHHSFPDENELANGVAVVRRDYEWSWDITLVTQAGAVSVTNPDNGSVPEEVMVTMYAFGRYAQKIRQSNLVQLGASVMQWEDDYYSLGELLVKVGEEFALTTGRDRFVLEMEYKKLAPKGELIVKQVREVPQADQTPSVTPFLIAVPAPYCVLQGEFGNVFANHRLKSKWQLETRSCWLTAENLAASLYGPASFEYMGDGVIGTLAGPISEWPGASHEYVPLATESPWLPDTPMSLDLDEQKPAEQDREPTNEVPPDNAPESPVVQEDPRTVPMSVYGATIDTWRMDNLTNPRTYRLHTDNIPALVSTAESAVLTLQDFRTLTLEVEYEKPVLQWDWEGPVMTTRDEVRLCPAFEPSSEDLLQKRRFEEPNGVIIETTFYWPPHPKGPTAGYTAPLARWVETRIEGCTSEPIVLRGDYSQTYRPEHHNFGEHFVFEPQLEPGLSSKVLAELREKDIRLLHVRSGMTEPEITTYGYTEGP